MDCPTCNIPMPRNGRTRSGKQRYYCKECMASATEGGRPRGAQPIGDKPMTAYERLKAWRERKKKKNKKDGE